MREARTFHFMVSHQELIAALKKQFPTHLGIQAIPVDCSFSAKPDSKVGLRVEYSKRIGGQGEVVEIDDEF